MIPDAPAPATASSTPPERSSKPPPANGTSRPAPARLSDPSGSNDPSARPPRTPLGEACALALTCALVGSVPASLRAARAGGPFLGGWLGSAAIVLPLLVLFIWLSHAAGRGFRMLTGNRAGRSTAAGLALWIGLSMPALLLLATLLKSTTHHRGLGGGTFGVLALAIVLMAALVARRLVTAARNLAAGGRNPRLIAAGFAAITIMPVLLVAFPLLRGADDSDAARRVVSALVDCAIFAVAAALAANAELRPPLRDRARSWGVLLSAVMFATGFGWVALSHSLGAALKSGGGLAAALIGGLERWTDRDGDGSGAYFGGADCDEGDPSRHPGAFDIPGDGIDQDCDGKDATAVTLSGSGASASVSSSPAATDQASRPSIMLVTMESVRADHTSVGGYEKKTTPRLEALALHGTSFMHAYASSSDTQHAVMPFVSGKPLADTPHDHREWPTIAASVDTLAERMKRAGYLTAGVSSFTWMSRERGFDQGFDSFDAVFTEDHPEHGITGPHAVRAARAFLAKNAADPRPIFLWVHLFDAHETFLPHTGLDFGKDQRGLYDGEVAYVDRQLGDLIDAVAASPRGTSTAFIVVGSNGEPLGEHGARGRKKELFDETVHVPLVIALPGQTSCLRYEGSAVSTFDAARTVLELGGASDEGTSGQSLLTVARGQAGPQREAVFAATSREAAVVAWPFKLVVESERKSKRSPKLFDLSKDPGEHHDLASDRPEDVARLRKLLEARGASESSRSSG